MDKQAMSRAQRALKALVEKMCSILKAVGATLGSTDGKQQGQIGQLGEKSPLPSVKRMD